MSDHTALTASCLRTLRQLGARDHASAETHRKAGQAKRTARHKHRADRLHLLAYREQQRSDELLDEVL